MFLKIFNKPDKDDEDDVQKAIVDSSAIMTILPFLNHASGFAALSAKTAQLIAELAKTGRLISLHYHHISRFSWSQVSLYFEAHVHSMQDIFVP